MAVVSLVEGSSFQRERGGGGRTDAEAEEAEQRDGVGAEAPAEVALAGLLLLLHCGIVVENGSAASGVDGSDVSGAPRFWSLPGSEAPSPGRWRAC